MRYFLLLITLGACVYNDIPQRKNPDVEPGDGDTLDVSTSSHVCNLFAEITTTADDQCLQSNGSLKVAAKGGQPPYQYKLNNGPFVATNEFHGLEAGACHITIIDGASCEYSVDIAVPRASTGISWLAQIQPIINTRCAKSGCHNDGAGRVAFTNWSTVNTNRNIIRSRVASGSMPYDGPLPNDQKAMIICWLDDGAPQN